MWTMSPVSRDPSRSRRGHAPRRAPHRAPAARLCGVGLVVLAASCADASGPERLRSTIAFDVGAITAASAQLGDGASIVGRAEVVISRGQQEVLRADQTLGSTDSIASFDIEIDAGTYDFRGLVYSNLDTLLYTGSTRQTISRDGFLVEIVPQAVTAVLVVSPLTQTVPFSPTGQAASAIIEVRNVGSIELLWDVDCVFERPSTTCQSGQNFMRPSVSSLDAGATDSTTAVLPRPGTWDLRFQTSVGPNFQFNIGSVTITVVVTP